MSIEKSSSANQNTQRSSMCYLRYYFYPSSHLSTPINGPSLSCSRTFQYQNTTFHFLLRHTFLYYVIRCSQISAIETLFRSNALNSYPLPQNIVPLPTQALSIKDLPFLSPRILLSPPERLSFCNKLLGII